MSDEIGLIEAMAEIGWRGGDLAGLGALSGRGRIGGPLEPLSEISPAAWPYLSWDSSRCDDTAVTPEGVRIYEVRLRYDATPADEDEKSSGDRPNGLPIGQIDADATCPPMVNDTDVFIEIILAQQAALAPLAVVEYEKLLSSNNLTLTPMGRVVGARIGDAGSVQRVATHAGPHLCYWLMVARYRMKREDFDAFPSGRAIAAELHSWVAVAHALVPGARSYGNKGNRDFDVLAQRLKRMFTITDG